jgi:hypothetical protein
METSVPGTIVADLQRLAVVREQKNALEKEETELRTRVLDAMAGAEVATFRGKAVAKTKSVPRTLIDSDLLKAKWPAIFEKVQKVSTSLRLEILTAKQ